MAVWFAPEWFAATVLTATLSASAVATAGEGSGHLDHVLGNELVVAIGNCGTSGPEARVSESETFVRGRLMPLEPDAGLDRAAYEAFIEADGSLGTATLKLTIAGRHARGDAVKAVLRGFVDAGGQRVDLVHPLDPSSRATLIRALSKCEDDDSYPQRRTRQIDGLPNWETVGLCIGTAELFEQIQWSPPPSPEEQRRAEWNRASRAGWGGLMPYEDRPPNAPEREELSMGDLMNVIVANKPAILACVSRKPEGAKGKILLRFTVRPSGATFDVAVQNEELKSTEMGRCLKALMEHMVFPKHRVQGEPHLFPFSY